MKKQRPELDLRQFLPSRLNRLSERVSNVLSAMYTRQFGLSVAEWRVLAWLSHKPSITAGEICRQAFMDKATVSRAVQRLEERQLLRRMQAPGDQRIQLLELTEQADELLRELLPKAFDLEAELVETFSAQELRDLLHLVGKLERQLSRMEGAEEV